MRTLRRLFYGATVALLATIATVSFALAISNPDAIRFYATGNTAVYRAFYNVNDEGDMLFVAEQYVYYTAEPTDYSARRAFLFEVLGTGGTSIASTTLNHYGAEPISVYLTSAQVISANISVGDALTLRIMGNPLIFPSTTNNTVSATLSASGYTNQLYGDDDGIATDNNLRNFLISMADDLQTADNITYIVSIMGVRYLNAIGGTMFLEGIPGLETMCPILFQYAVSPVAGDEPESTGAYASTLSPLAKWGQTSADGLTNLGLYLGINQRLAGSVVLFLFVVLFAIFVYQKTQSGIAVLILVASMPSIGAWFGLMPIALAFVFTIVIVVLLGFFFFNRGAL